MKSSLANSLRFTGFLLLSACASHGGLEGQRLPASVPWAPGTTSGVPPTANNQPWTNTVNPNAPWAHTGENPAAPTTPGAPSSANAPAQCSIPFNQVPVGGGYTVNSLLINVGNYGTFTGNWGRDQQILQPWFANSAPGTDVYNAAKDSKAFFSAIQYADGNVSNAQGSTMTWQDYQVGQRMAAILVAMMATSHDPECTRLIRTYADRILGATVAKELDDLPFVAAAQLVHDGQIQGKFQEVDANRKDLEKQIDDQDGVIARKEKQNAVQLKSLQSELQARYDALKDSLQSIPPCADTVGFKYLTADPNEGFDDQSQDLVNSCQDAIDTRLSTLHDKEIDLMAQAKAMSDRGGKQDFAGSQQSVINQKLADIQTETTQIQGYQALLTAGGDSSITGQISQIDALLKTEQADQTQTYLQADQQKKTELTQRLQQLSARWLTYGYFGGFNAK